jgi:tryptophanyl-tRNA synthetase
MIKPAIELQKTHETFYFIANYHALTTVRDAEQLRHDTFSVAATFIALGYDTQKGALFRQSDIPEVTELTWLLSCAVSMGDLTRAHAYKAAKDRGEEGTLNMGVFAYPVLMAADILLYDSDVVPVGKDQLQHIEMARAIAKRFNHHFGETFKEPQEYIRPEVAVVPGLDGRKMSKSYNNGIEPLAPSKQLKKQIMAIVTDSKGLEDVKDPANDNVVALYKLFATPEELKEMEENYRRGGYGYGHAKLALFEKFEAVFGPARKRYDELMNDRAELEKVLKQGAEKARSKAADVIARARKACGVE